MRSVGLDRQRLLPASLEAWLVGCLNRAGGLSILAVAALLWGAVLTWSATDPSLTHTTAEPARNWLGNPGAIVADLILQTLGFAAAIPLLVAMLWGLELTFSRRLANARQRAVYFPIALIALSAALSALPVPEAWPFRHGCGGILGDMVLRGGSSAFAFFNPERAQLAATLLFSLAGLSALGGALELELRDLPRLVPRRRALRPDVLFSWLFSVVAAPAVWLWQLWNDRQASAVDREAGDFPPFERADVRRFPIHTAPDEAQSGPAYAASYPDLEDDEEIDLDSEIDIDDETGLSSRLIAERFAPPGAVPRAEPPPRPVVAVPAPVAAPAAHRPVETRRAEATLERPPLSALERIASARTPAVSQAALDKTARALEAVLADFGIQGEIRAIRPGPVVTLFELEPARGTKTSRIVSLADDIARSMSAASVRVAVVPGRNAIGIELPNARREPVGLRELVEQEAFRAAEGALPLALGKSISGETVVADLARMPHLLVAGTTGSGKSVGVNAMILSLLFRHSPDECRFLMIDPKMLELSVYNGIPHLLCPVVTEPQKAVAALNWAVGEMEERYKLMSRLSVRNIEAFNARVRDAEKGGGAIARTVQTGYDRRTGQALYEREKMSFEPMPYIVVVVDEFADLMLASGKEVETAVQRLAQKARAAGIHLIMATQRPSVDVITGTIKANFPTRISFKVASKIDSRTILNEQGGEQLLGQGDMLYAGGGQTLRIHGPFVSDSEVERVADNLRRQGPPRYITGIDAAARSGESGAGAPSETDDLFAEAAEIVLRDRKASTSYLQRRLSIGYNRAADLIERLEREGLVSAPNHMGRRDVLGAEAARSAPAF